MKGSWVRLREETSLRCRSSATPTVGPATFPHASPRTFVPQIRHRRECNSRLRITIAVAFLDGVAVSAASVRIQRDAALFKQIVTGVLRARLASGLETERSSRFGACMPGSVANVTIIH